MQRQVDGAVVHIWYCMYYCVSVASLHLPATHRHCVGQQPVSYAYVTTLTFNGSCPSNETSQLELMTSLSMELNRQALCVWSDPLADVCDISNYAVCPGASSQRRRTGRQADRSSPLTLSVVLYVPRTYVAESLYLVYLRFCFETIISTDTRPDLVRVPQLWQRDRASSAIF